MNFGDLLLQTFQSEPPFLEQLHLAGSIFVHGGDLLLPLDEHPTILQLSDERHALRIVLSLIQRLLECGYRWAPKNHQELPMLPPTVECWPVRRLRAPREVWGLSPGVDPAAGPASDVTGAIVQFLRSSTTPLCVVSDLSSATLPTVDEVRGESGPTRLELATIPCEPLSVALPESKSKNTTTCLHAQATRSKVRSTWMFFDKYESETPERNLDRRALQIIDIFSGSGHPVVQATTAFEQDSLKTKRSETTIHFNAIEDSVNMICKLVKWENSRFSEVHGQLA